MVARGRPEAPRGGTENHQRSTAMKKKKKTKRLAPEQVPPTNEPDLKKQKAKVEEEEEMDQELTPEEKRKLERKLKKERKKEEKKSMREAGIAVKKEEVKKASASELALEYLTSWSENPDGWKFQKTRQTWLLLHMYNNDMVPDKYFSILLQYLEGLQGSARSVTIEKAEALMKEYDASEMEDANLLQKRERIRKVLQLLS